MGIKTFYLGPDCTNVVLVQDYLSMRCPRVGKSRTVVREDEKCSDGVRTSSLLRDDDTYCLI